MADTLIDPAGRPVGALTPSDIQRLNLETALSTQAANRATQLRSLLGAALDAQHLAALLDAPDAAAASEASRALLRHVRVLLGLVAPPGESQPREA